MDYAEKQREVNIANAADVWRILEAEYPGSEKDDMVVNMLIDIMHACDHAGGPDGALPFDLMLDRAMESYKGDISHQ